MQSTTGDDESVVYRGDQAVGGPVLGAIASQGAVRLQYEGSDLSGELVVAAGDLGDLAAFAAQVAAAEAATAQSPAPLVVQPVEVEQAQDDTAPALPPTTEGTVVEPSEAGSAPATDPDDGASGS